MHDINEMDAILGLVNKVSEEDDEGETKDLNTKSPSPKLKVKKTVSKQIELLT